MKKVIITGSSSGLGLSLAKKFLDEGYFVIGLSNSEGIIVNLSYVHRKINLALPAEVNNFISFIKQEHDNFDLIINNAGMLYTADISNYDIENLIESFSINVFSHMKITGDLFPLIEKNGADIINITSSSLEGTYPSFLAYSASKAALRQFTKELNSSLKDTNSRVTEFCPAGFQSNIWKKMKGLSLERDENKRMNVDDVANIILFISKLTKDIEIPFIKINNKKDR
ncbi:SDR family oxidoreductase [Patescibacteria group bacterium]|nr:SDR family oxidoreductase [Patescibacteria group bacterium]